MSKCYVSAQAPVFITNNGHVNYEYLVIDSEDRFYVNLGIQAFPGMKNFGYNGPVQVTSHVKPGETLYIVLRVDQENDVILFATRHLDSARNLVEYHEGENAKRCYIVPTIVGSSEGYSVPLQQNLH